MDSEVVLDSGRNCILSPQRMRKSVEKLEEGRRRVDIVGGWNKTPRVEEKLEAVSSLHHSPQYPTSLFTLL